MKTPPNEVSISFGADPDADLRAPKRSYLPSTGPTTSFRERLPRGSGRPGTDLPDARMSRKTREWASSRRRAAAPPPPSDSRSRSAEGGSKSRWAGRGRGRGRASDAKQHSSASAGSKQGEAKKRTQSRSIRAPDDDKFDRLLNEVEREQKKQEARSRARSRPATPAGRFQLDETQWEHTEWKTEHHRHLKGEWGDEEAMVGHLGMLHPDRAPLTVYTPVYDAFGPSSARTWVVL